MGCKVEKKNKQEYKKPEVIVLSAELTQATGTLKVIAQSSENAAMTMGRS